LVAEPLHADPVFYGVRPCGDGSRRKAVRRHRGLPPLLEKQFGYFKGIGNQKGGAIVSGIHFVAAGGPIGSMLALMSYFGSGVIKERYLGLKIPPANLMPNYLGECRAFADELADSLGCAKA
jgi:hypothetical protein